MVVDDAEAMGNTTIESKKRDSGSANSKPRYIYLTWPLTSSHVTRS
jgi:hypothetical protein